MTIVFRRTGGRIPGHLEDTRLVAFKPIRYADGTRIILG